MPRKLLIINAMLLFIAAGSVTFIVRQLTAPMPMPQASRTRTAATVTGRTQEPRQQAGAYAAVAARNLFSPTRTESPPTAAAAVAPSPAVKPNLYGVVLRDGAPLAYLEDPSSKRVAGYQVGDSLAGGTVQAISADGVVIARPDGNMDVRLRDPSRARPAAPATAAVPGAQPVAGPAVLPGVIPPATGGPGATAHGQMTIPQPTIQPPPGQIGQPVTPPVVQGRRPLPPNLLRRLPQGPQTDAPQP
jgi:Type II secretion system protein C